MRRLPSALAIALVMAGCTASTLATHESASPLGGISMTPAAPHGSPRPASPPESEFLYELLMPAALGIACVFDDGRGTYVMFESAVPDGLMVFDENGKPLHFFESGRAILVDAVHSGILLRTPTKASFAKNRIPDPVAHVSAMGMGPADNGAALPADLAAARVELLQAQATLSEVSEALALADTVETRVSTAKLKAELDETEAMLDGLHAKLVRAHFKTGSALLAISDAVKDALIKAAREAEEVRIRGRADATGTVETNLRIARERAFAVRRVLLEGGIEEKKLKTSFAPADYIATNATAEGRAQNRRVDVLLVNAASEASRPLEKPVADNVP